MGLSTGTRLGPYEILSPLGAGGMGEVYRAKDTRLERTVAIKVLNSQVAATPELRARFEREARIISQLQHPHICVLHDVGRENGTEFLVMEFLEGESLAERLKKGALPIEDLLRIALQIADALEKAHRAGVVHRDLKPGNVMLTKSGAKLLDFGLAKPLAAGATARAGSAASVSVFSAALTQTSPVPSPASPLSSAGVAIGTVQYMSPEQIQGLEADPRSDIFAFGVMLFEMATGKRAFEGKSQASIVGQILAVDPPPVRTLRPETPPALERVIRVCLEKDPDERIQTAHDLKLELQGIAEIPAQPERVAAGGRARIGWVPWTAAAVLAITAIVLAWAYSQAKHLPATSVHSYILPPTKVSFELAGTGAGPPAVSPDGLRITFVARAANGTPILWVQPLNSAVAQPIAGTEGATYPFWSADSRYIGFFAHAKLNKVDAAGGPPQVLCDAPDGRGGAWNNDGVILFTPATSSRLMRVDSGGGTPIQVTDLGRTQDSHRWPQFLPDGKHFLYFAHGGNSEMGIYVGSLDSKQSKLLLRNDSNAIYAAPGYLLFARDNSLMAQRFDSGKLELVGDAQPLTDHVDVNVNVWKSIVTASANGILLYQTGSLAGSSQLIWFDRSGKQGATILGGKNAYSGPVLSPDGTKVAVGVQNSGVTDIWVLDLVRNTKTRITFGSLRAYFPAWWPDSRSLVYSSLATSGSTAVFRKNADGTGSPEKLLEEPATTDLASSVSRDGRYLVYLRDNSKSQSSWDIWAMPLFGDRKPFPVVNTQFRDLTPALSSDDKWLAYNNDESGRMEVYIQPFPRGAGRWQVSTSGGYRPAWRKDGRELYFVSPDQEIMAVNVIEKGNSLQLGTPHALFKASMVASPSGPFAVSADGKKFLVNVVQSTAEPLTLVTNWTADLKK